MTKPPTSASRPEPAPAGPPSPPPSPADAKVKFIDAAYAASPLRLVEKRPLLSVTAAASVALAATVIIGEPVIRSVSGGLFTHGLGIASTLLRSQAASALLNRFGPTAVNAAADQAGTASQAQTG